MKQEILAWLQGPRDFDAKEEPCTKSMVITNAYNGI